ncbi:unnamed protein product [Urochloa decumbens]|uniref:F-box domain-containing protein n=1 Tax=Urochloa decumbens TaxID=240449 RepID=A0ABC9EF95_9POAL
MEDLSEPLLGEIITRITRTSDLNSLSLVSKRLYNVEAEERATLRVGCDLTLSFCSCIDNSGLGYLSYCKKLMALRLNAVPAITSGGLLSVAVGCKSLSTLHLTDCMKVGSVEAVVPQHECERLWYGTPIQQKKMRIRCPGDSGMEWLEYLGKTGSLVDLVVKDCKGISQYDLLKFGPGWMKLEKFEFEINDNYWLSGPPLDPSYNVDYPYKYDICCNNMKDLRLAKIITVPEIGLRFLLGQCRALEKLCLHYVVGLDESQMITLFQNCRNLRSISLQLMPLRCGFSFRTPLTDDSLETLSHCCPMLEVVELTFAFCSSTYPTEIGFTQKGIITLVQTCPTCVFVLNGARIFKDEGMKDISSAQFLETLELVDCKGIADVGISYMKLESLTVVGCRLISEEAVQGAARSVRYSSELESQDSLKGMKMARIVSKE